MNKISGLFVVALAAAVAGTIWLYAAFPPTLDDVLGAAKNNLVTLNAAPGNDIVQMFERVGDGDEGKVSYFNDGTSCTKLAGPLTVNVAGISLRFHKLTCNGVSGYVNVKWVD